MEATKFEAKLLGSLESLGPELGVPGALFNNQIVLPIGF